MSIYKKIKARRSARQYEKYYTFFKKALKDFEDPYNPILQDILYDLHKTNSEIRWLALVYLRDYLKRDGRIYSKYLSMWGKSTRENLDECGKQLMVYYMENADTVFNMEEYEMRLAYFE
jgi:hypothetical protein